MSGIIPENKKRPGWIWITGALFLLIVLLLLVWIFTKERVNPLTAEERAWLKAHPVIRLAPDPDFPPVEYFDKNGVYNGITKDYVSLLEKKLGVRFKIVRLSDWNEIVGKTKSREIDIYVATKTPQRSAYLLFTEPFLEFPAVIIAREKVKGPLTLEKLNGMKVSVVSEYAAQNFISYNYPKLNLDLVPDVQTGLRKVSFGLSDAFVENLATATYYIEKEGITNLRIAGDSGYFYRMGFCSRKDWPKLNRILEKGLAEISAVEKKAIYEKWIPVEPLSFFASTGFRTGILAAGAAILMIIAGIIAWNRALSRQVRLRTAELENELAERKLVEEKLRFTQFAVDNTVDQAFWMTEDGCLFYVNDAACRALGYTREELVGMSIPDIDPIYQREKFVEHWRELRENGSVMMESLHRAKDGRVYPVEVRANLVVFEGKEYNCAFATDISERKRTEEALRESEQKFRVLAETSPVAIIVYQGEKNVYVNPATTRIIGYTEQDCLEMKFWDWTHEDFKEEVRNRGLARQQGEPVPPRYEFKCVTKSGEEKWVFLSAGCIEYEGAPAGIVSIFDISDRKRMEKELERARDELEKRVEERTAELAETVNKLLLSQFCIEKAAIGIYHTTFEGDILSANDFACRSLGYTAEKLCTLKVPDIDPAITQEKMHEIKRMLDETGSATHETVHRRKDGTTFPVEITANNLEYHGKSYTFSFVKDITERKRAEEALKESESRVRRKLESILDPEGDTGELDLADILEVPEIQALMDDLYRITGLKMSIIDLKGRVLADVGWQDICSKFHRIHPETVKKCLESDSDLTVGVPQGEFKTYRCKNNMWHIVTPIIVGGRHMGNLFMGRFFFGDEEIDYDLFRSQARKYGFPEEEYIAALEAVPRHSEELVNLGKAVFLRLTDMFSKLSYANIKLAQSLAERDQLTATLRQANLVVENSPVVLFRWKGDDEWPVELVSGNIKQFGYTPDDFLSGSISYSSIIHSDDLERVTREVHDFCDEGTDQFRLEYRIMTKGGDIRWVNEHTNVERDAAGGVSNFEGIVIDVTERKRAEDSIRESRAKYQAIVDSFDGLIYISSQDYRIEFINRKLIERTGRDAVGEYCYKVMNDLDSVCPWCVNDRVFKGETVHREMFSPKDNRWYHAVNVPIRNADGSMSKHTMIIDITERKLFEEELKRQKQLLEDLNETLENRVEEEVAKNREKDIMLIQQHRQAALGEMLDHIAHQWKQPLNTISLIIQDLGETFSCGELNCEYIIETVDKTTDLLEHMAQTIDVFRDFYRPEKEKTVFRIKDSIDRALSFIAPALRYHAISVDLDIDSGLSAIGYPKEYAQVLLNILSNARDAVKERGTASPEVKVKAFAEDNKAVVTITDNAGGIPDTIAGKIFDLYFTTKESCGGTGIGLYMSKNIIEKNMGGRLSAGNTDNGAQFRIELNMPRS